MIAYEFVSDCVDMIVPMTLTRILTTLAHMYSLVGWLRM